MLTKQQSNQTALAHSGSTHSARNSRADSADLKSVSAKSTNQPIRILAIESSCDETACAIVQKNPDDSVATVLSSITATSLVKHKATKGIVPEVAAREQLKYILPVIEETLTTYNLPPTTIDYVAVTTGPGLVGSLLVGIETARALAMAWDKPIIPVNHIQAHPYANFIKSDDIQILNQVQDDASELTNKQPTNKATNKPQFPLLSWVISGGHTDLYLMKSHEEIIHLGSTVDDAAGECFDKCARVLGFDYPGGPFIEKIANSSAALSIKLPRPLIHEKTFNMSFSGLKTAFLRAFKENQDTIIEADLKAYLAYELQEAVTDVIVKKTQRALEHYPEVKSIIVSGGVAANKRLREKMESQILNQVQDDASELSTKQPINQLTNQLTLHFPPLSLCTDNAAMIGAYAAFHLDQATSWSNIHLNL